MTALKILLASLLVGFSAYYFYSQESFSADMARGKRVLVTGSSTGIGEQIAYEFARLGAHVMLTARREKQLREVVHKCLELGASSARYVVSDMGNLTSAQKVVEEVESKLGGLDYLVLNHAGGTGGIKVFEGNMETLISSMTINFLSYGQMTVSALNMLNESNGNIIVMSSICGRIATPFTVPYAAAKFALEGFYSGLRAELRLRKINVAVTVAVLGYINTDNAMKQVEGKIALTASSKEDCAREVVKAGVLRQREVFYPYWSTRAVLFFKDWIPEQISDRNYNLENIL